MTFWREPSRCLTPSVPPLEVIWYFDDVAGVSVLQEVLDATQDLPPVERATRRADVRDRVKKAAAGDLAAYDDDFFVPVSSNPFLWEHKWKEYDYRIYHGEPRDVFAIVLLRFHVKWVEGMPAEIKFAQQQEMLVAGERFDYGREFVWDRRVRFGGVG